MISVNTCSYDGLETLTLTLFEVLSGVLTLALTLSLSLSLKPTSVVLLISVSY